MFGAKAGRSDTRRKRWRAKSYTFLAHWARHSNTAKIRLLILCGPKKRGPLKPEGRAICAKKTAKTDLQETPARPQAAQKGAHHSNFGPRRKLMETLSESPLEASAADVLSATLAENGFRLLAASSVIEIHVVEFCTIFRA